MVLEGFRDVILIYDQESERKWSNEREYKN